MEHPNDFIKDKRTEYGADNLDITAISADPVRLFETWFQLAISRSVNEPHAMVLSTVSQNGRPSSRVVLLRNFGSDGFTFYTNYFSRKGNELEQKPVAALNFFWPELEKQIRVEGAVVRVPDSDSVAYFQSRPRESQIGAWASLQSQPLSGREELDEKMEILTKQFEGKPIPRPEHWGGYCVKPDYFEFWQGRKSRLHDRVEYKFDSGKWVINRLYP